MAQIGYNTITITDNTDIERIYMQYCRSTDNQLTNDEVAHQTVTWQDTTPGWVNGQYIWSRSVVKYYGVTNLTYGVPVCITGAQGQTGGTGAAGRSLTSTVTQYTTATNSATINESTMNNYTWNNNVPTYSSSTPAYWIRVTNTYSNPSSTEYIIYKDNGLTDAIKTSHDANTTAQSADSKADQAISDASSALTQANNTNTALNNYKTANDTAVNALKAQATHYWWDSEGAHVASGVSPMASDNLTQGTPSTYGFNALMAPGSLALRQKNINLAQLATNALTFYIPPNSSTTQGPKALEVGTRGLKMYNPVANNNVELMSLSTGAITFKDVNGNVQATFGVNGAIQSGNYVRGTANTTFASNGTKIDLINGEIFTKYFRLSQGVESNVPAGVYIEGTIQGSDSRIGTDTTNYWQIGDYTDYNLTSSASMIGHGSSFIQLGDNSTWRLATNRIHTGWYTDNDDLIHYNKFTDGTTQRFWDYGIHVPTSKSDKFLYIRQANNTAMSGEDDEDRLTNLLYDIDDNYGTSQWTYKFYIDGEGNLHAGDIYSNGQLISGTSAPYLLKTYESQTLTGALTITGNLTVNGTITGNLTGNVTGNVTGSAGKLSNTSKIGDTNKPVYFTANGVPTAISYEINKTVPSNAIFTDANVTQTATTTNSAYELLFSGTADNTTRTEGTRKTSTLTYNPSTKALVTGGTVNGYILAAASAKGVDTSMTASSTSTNLPTTKAVADLIKTYLPLSGGTVSGETIFNDAVSVNDEFDADSITAGNLIVTGVGRFTNGIYGDLNGNVTGNVTGSLTGNATTATTATKVGNNLIIKLNSGTTEGTNMFTFNGSAAKTVDVTKSAIGLGNVENKSSATIRGELTSANVTTALGFTPYNSTNPNGYVTSSGVTSVTIAATSPVVSSTATAQTGSSVSTTISLADGYGDTKNPYGSKTARYVLAAPASAAGAPTFRALTNADVGLGNVTNNKQVKGLSSGTTSGHLVTWGTDGYTVVDSGIALAPNGNTRGIVSGLASDNNGKIVLTYADGTTSNPIEVKIIGQEGSSVSYADKLNVNGAAVGSATVPVYFNANGEVQTANTYAGGTAVTLNGASKAASTASFYAPTAAGTNGQFLVSTGGTPGWQTITRITGVKGNSESSYRTGQVNLTPANLGAVATTGDETVAGKKTFSDILQVNKTIRDSAGQHYYGGAANRSQWYKITLAHNGITPPSTAQWYMCSMTIHIAGDYNGNPRGTIELCYYIYWSGSAYRADNVYATGYGPQINKVKIYYNLTDPFILYVDSTNPYTSIWVDYVSYRDSAQSHNTKETKVETTSAITVADYTVVPTTYMYTTNGSSFYVTNHLYPNVNNSFNLGSSSYKWANVYATTFTGNLTGNVTGTASGNVTSIQYDSTNTKFTYTKNGSNTDIVTIANLKTYLGLKALAYKDSLTKSDVGLGNVDNIADADKRVKGANITTTANAVAKYSDTSGTFADSNVRIENNDVIIGSTGASPDYTVTGAGNFKIGARDDSKGVMPYANNWNQIGSSSLYWYRGYINHIYGNTLHMTNWDAGKNIGTAATSSAVSTIGSVNFYNTCAAGGTQTKTLLTVDSSTNSNITITLPKVTGTIALISDLSDTKVTQSSSTTANWRKVLLHYKDDAASTTAVTSSIQQVYAAVGVSVQPSTGTLRTTASQINEWNISEDTTTKALVFKFVG